MRIHKEEFTYSDLLLCFDILRRHTGGKPIAYLMGLVGWAVMDRDLNEMLRYLVRRKRLARTGRGDRTTFRLLEPASKDAILERKLRKAARPWNHRWYILAYDVPVHYNTIRKRLVGFLYDMGFAMMSASSWISPYDWSESWAKS